MTDTPLLDQDRERMRTQERQWNGRPFMRYRLLHDDPRFGLSEGDILLCEEMHWAWAEWKVAVIRRESDSYVPMCSMYRHSVELVRQPPG